MKHPVNGLVFTTILIFLYASPLAAEKIRAGSDMVLPDVPSASEEEPPGQAPESLYKYQALVEKLGSEQGVYGHALGEALIGLGMAYRSLGRYEDALGAFDQALYVNRVNEGLHNLDHVAILEMIIESNTLLQDWDALGRNYDYMYWIFRRNFGQSDVMLLPVIERIGQWRLNAFYHHPRGLGVDHLLKADDIYGDAIDIINRGDEIDEKEAVRFLNGVAVTNFHIADTVRDKFKISQRELREVMISNNRSNPYVNEIAVRDFYYWQSLFKGERAIKEIIELYAARLPGSVIEYAKALIFLGDYYLALKKRWEAMRNYKKAHQVLVDNHIGGSRINSLFGEPKPLQTLSFTGKDDYEIAAGTAYVDAVLDVTDGGWPRNIRITKTHPLEDPELSDRGKLAITGLLYRPRFESGRPVDATDVRLRYYFAD